MKPLLSLLQRSLSFIVWSLLLSSLVCPLHAGTISAINFNLQGAPSAARSSIVTAEGWGIKLTAYRKQNPVSPLQIYLQSQLPQAGAILPPPVAKTSIGMMSHHDRNEESSEAISMVGLAFVQKAYQSLQALFDWPPTTLVMLAAGLGTAGGGDDDDGDDHSHTDKFEREPQAEFFTWAPDAFTQCCLKQKKRLLTILRKKMQWAQACGNRDLGLILRDRIMLIEIDRDLLQQQTSHLTSSCPSLVYEWLLRDSLEIRYYDQAVNGRDCKIPWARRGRQAGTGEAASGSGAASKGQAGSSAQPDGETFHHLPPAVSSDNGDEREEGDGTPPPAKKARMEPAASVTCSLCQKTLNEQEVARVLQSTAEPVVCDACLLSLPQGTSGKRKAARKRAQSDLAAPESKRSKSQTEKRKQSSSRQRKPAARRVRLENPEVEAQSTPDTVEELEALRVQLTFEMNEQESEAAKQFFEHLKRRKIRIKTSLYKLLTKVNRDDFPTLCTKASVFFGSLTASIQDTGCLTSMLKTKTHIRDFAGRESSELEYLAGLDTLRAFSSMNNGKGLPKQDEVKKVLGWPEWKDEDGQFSMERFRAFSSMNNGKGLPKQDEVKKVLGWPEWKDEDGQFSMERFRAFSSMNSSRGLPKQDEVKKVLGWPEWKDEDGQFSMERFRAFSSMNNGKGLPKQDEVKKVLGWPEWKDEDGQFSMERFRAFSSMNNGKGLPKQDEVKKVLGWPEWKDEDGQFSMERFRAFSSMNNGKGLPKQDEVKKVLGWPEWKDEDGQFSMERFRAFSSVNNGKGLPKQDEVKKVLGWPEWKDEDGQFSMERFRAFSSMNNGKGLPKQDEVKKVLGWLRCEETQSGSHFQLMIRLHASKGMPDIKQLIHYEQKLTLLFANTVTDLDSDDEDEQSCLIKQTALFLSSRMPQYVVNFENVWCFHQQEEAGDAGRKLEKLLKLLISYGGRGVTRYLSLNASDRKALLSTSTSHIPLPLAIKAINDFSPQERKQYLFFNRNLKAPPSKDQWNGISLQLDRLASVLKTPHAQRLYLEVVWSLAPSDRAFFLDETSAASVTKIFPSLNALKKLANRHSRQWLKELLEACLQHGQGTPSRENIKQLFTALLETQHPLFDHGDIPDYFLSGYMALGDSAILIPVSPPVQTTEALALHFVAAVMGVLSDMFYHYGANRLKIEQYGGETYPFPIPELEIRDDGIEISNWSDKVFKDFLDVTEFPEHYYLSEDAWQQHCSSEVPSYFQRRMAACHQRQRTAPETIAFQPISIPALMGLLKHNIPIKPTVWKSFDHHKDRLPRAAYSRLLNEIEKSTHENIPVSLKDYLEARRLPEETLPQNEMEAPTSTPPFMVGETLSEEEQFQRLWKDLSHKELLVVADLELLADYKEHMTMEQIVSILERADIGMETDSLDKLRLFLGEKRDGYLKRDPLLLGLPDEVVRYLIEADI